MTDQQQKAFAKLRELQAQRYANFEISSDRIVSGVGLVQEYCLTRVLERTPTSLRSEAVWHEDVHDPGDAALVVVTLTRDGDVIRNAS